MALDEFTAILSDRAFTSAIQRLAIRSRCRNISFRETPISGKNSATDANTNQTSKLGTERIHRLNLLIVDSLVSNVESGSKPKIIFENMKW